MLVNSLLEMTNNSAIGTKYRREDIQQEINDIADIAIDYGLLKYNRYQRSSTSTYSPGESLAPPNLHTLIVVCLTNPCYNIVIDFSGPKPEIVRIGACYEVIKDALWRNFQIETPDDPGLEKNPFGHLKNQEPLESLEKLIAAPRIKA